MIEKKKEGRSKEAFYYARWGRARGAGARALRKLGARLSILAAAHFVREKVGTSKHGDEHNEKTSNHNHEPIDAVYYTHHKFTRTRRNLSGGLHACISVYTTAHPSLPKRFHKIIIHSKSSLDISPAHNPTETPYDPQKSALVETLGRAHGGLDGQ